MLEYPLIVAAVAANASGKKAILMKFYKTFSRLFTYIYCDATHLQFSDEVTLVD